MDAAQNVVQEVIDAFQELKVYNDDFIAALHDFRSQLRVSAWVIDLIRACVYHIIGIR